MGAVVVLLLVLAGAAQMPYSADRIVVGEIYAKQTSGGTFRHIDSLGRSAILQPVLVSVSVFDVILDKVYEPA